MMISSIFRSILSIINGVIKDNVIRFINLQFLVMRSVLSGDVKGKKTSEQGV